MNDLINAIGISLRQPGSDGIAIFLKRWFFRIGNSLVTNRYPKAFGSFAVFCYFDDRISERMANQLSTITGTAYIVPFQFFQSLQYASSPVMTDVRLMLGKKPIRRRFIVNNRMKVLLGGKKIGNLGSIICQLSQTLNFSKFLFQYHIHIPLF